jgi:hypothetical protein
VRPESLQIRNFISGEFVERIGGRHLDNIEAAVWERIACPPVRERLACGRMRPRLRELFDSPNVRQRIPENNFA